MEPKCGKCANPENPQSVKPEYVGSDLFPSIQVAAAYEIWVKGFDLNSKYARWVGIADGDIEVAARAFVAGIKYANEREN